MLLALEDLALVRGGQSIFEGLSLSLDSGESLTVLAPNGAGKTSLFMVLAGLLAPAKGHCTIAGLDIVSRREKALAHIGYVPSRIPLWPGYTVSRFLQTLAGLRGLNPASAALAAKECICSCDLVSQSNSPVETLSGGYLKRLGLAQALVHHPSLLLLDELSAGLDHGARLALSDLCKALEPKPAIIRATHHFDEVEGGALLFLPPGSPPAHYAPEREWGKAELEELWQRHYGRGDA